MQPRFLYFDLGKVLVDFSLDQMLRQMADVAGVEPEAIRDVMLNEGLMQKHESGKLSAREFHDAFCKSIGKHADFDALVKAASEIFTLKPSMLPIVSQLRQAGCRLGILSNTSLTHWEYCRRQYRILTEGFDVYALSFRIGEVKPNAAIFHAAAELAGVQPEEVFFCDDIAGHIEGARAAGFDAVQFTTASALASQLRRRGIRFNY